MSQQSKLHNFEKSLVELEELIDHMEQADLSLEESLAHFERGISLSKHCQDALQKAEQKVKILLEEKVTPAEQADAKLVDFNPDIDQNNDRSV